MGFRIKNRQQISVLVIVTIYFLCVFVLDQTLARKNQTRSITAAKLKLRINSNLNTTSNRTGSDLNQRSCECMEYWNCTTRKGQIYSYCGISDSEVCCFFDDSLPVKPLPEILPNASNLIPNPEIRVNRTGIPCGVAAIKGNLDSVAAFKEWPWHVAILEAKDDLYICGGSLISNRTVLTAAHCLKPYVTGKKNQRLKIRAGEYDVSGNSESIPHIEILVHGMTLHPNFTASLENDIAVLELVRAIPDLNTRENIAPICLPTINLSNIDNSTSTMNGTAKNCVVTGWGRQSENSKHSLILKEIIVPIWDQVQCERSLQRHFGPEYRLAKSRICAGAEGRDACDGDGGGPLVCQENGVWIQEGIVSFGIGCGRPNSPGVYTRVSSHMQFLKPFL